MSQLKNARRNAEIAKIHIAKSYLGLDETAYRTMLKEIGGNASSAKLTPAGRRKVLNHLAALGWQPKGKKIGKRPHNMQRGKGRTSRTAQLEKIEALLTIGGKPWGYADALAKRICKVEKMIWVPEDELYKIITALYKQAQREGWDLSGE